MPYELIDFVALIVRQEVYGNWYDFLFKGMSMYLTDIVAAVDFGQMSVRYCLLDILSNFNEMRSKDSSLTCQYLDFAVCVGSEFVGQGVDVFFC